MRPLEPGLTLRAWRLISRLGRGGDGDVWLAVDTRGQEVALKARPREGRAEEQRLRNEFERLRTLNVPHVVRVLDVGSDQGYIFFTMEVARGRHFTLYVNEGATLSERVQRLARAGASTARAVAGIHRLGLAHRDLKPANVLVSDDGEATILDFGAMRFGAGQDESGNFAGTVAYMAPEQRVGMAHDARVDRYALGVMLHEALSGLPANQGQPGRPRPSLLMLGPEVPLALASLVDALVSLDPVERPSAEDAERVLTAVADGLPLPAAPWPSPLRYAGDVSSLMNTNAVVVGRPGSGRRRMVQEARLLWQRRGYRSVAGNCTPDRPYGALREVLMALFAVQDPDLRRRLAGDEAPILHALWPALPVPVWEAAPSLPDPETTARAFSRVLTRAAPLAVALWNLDEADPGTTAVLAALCRSLPPRVQLWATSRAPQPGLPAIKPPTWTPALEDDALSNMLPQGLSPVGERGTTPLESAARVWRALAASRGVPGPAVTVPPALVRLSVLPDPFPARVAAAMTEGVEALRTAGHLVEVKPESYGVAPTPDAGDGARGERWLAFADLGTRRLAEAAQPEDNRQLHLDAARAWESVPGVEDRLLRGVHHRAAAGRPDPRSFRRAIRQALERANVSDAERWVQLHDLWTPGPDDFFLASSRLRAALELRPTAVRRDAMDQLLALARTPEQNGEVALIHVVWLGRNGDPRQAIDHGLQWASWATVPHPGLAADLLRQVALIRLDLDEVDEALAECRRALVLAREASWRGSADGPTDSFQAGSPPPPRAPRLSRAEVEVATTLSAALLYAGRTSEGTRLCEEMADRCERAGLSRSQGAFLANLAAGQIYLGQRDRASFSLARCREVQHLHGDPLVLANAVTLQARLAVERGDRASGRLFLDDAMTLSQAIGSPRLTAEIWPLVLEGAVQAADPGEAQRAITAYEAANMRSSVDHWPAVLGRWLWLSGDLNGALQALDEPRIGHSGELVRAERCRLLLVSGRYADATSEAEALVKDAVAADFVEIAQFGKLVAAAASAAPDGAVESIVAETRASRWVHLYLGALHLDAIRRQLRGENPRPVLRQLRARSQDLGHTLYAALAREEAW